MKKGKKEEEVKMRDYDVNAVLEGLTLCSDIRCHRCPYKGKENCVKELLLDACACIGYLSEHLRSATKLYSDTLVSLDLEGIDAVTGYVESLKEHYPNSASVVKTIDEERRKFLLAVYDYDVDAHKGNVENAVQN